MSVLILGATSPIARQLAARYAEAGWPVYVAARDGEEAARIAADLRVRFDVEATSGVFDARDFDHHPAFIEGVEAALGPISVAVLAFGAMGEQEASQEDFEAARAVIEVNYAGAVSISEALAARLSQRPGALLVGLTSVAGDRGRQSNYIYGSAKGAFALYLQGLRNRLFRQGVHVMTVKLGFVDTRMTFGMETALPIADPVEVSRALYEAANRRVDTLYYPPLWRGVMSIIRSIPEAAFKRLSL
ncbi:SDR family oxidoreductase [Myxococcota bacterium]|nr:SDR family oxidoreductase [Myxococcota bacterium]MBU1430526.1 SDR family oxidoreductase [Myxococcota bacterium]MBU1900220.1 SDR family oxidoreductase [Myxococcota bacterium]